ncbi:hypothetical protein A3752_24970 [Oleiphilus sp. HI0081]|nr:hypothetical protein A3729_18405 [Oleiphilus sp. HI0043]KZY80652.1 hypothetical protein A3741_18460 [Oleiphilus sp. HI0069]KZY89570.1 hypothetical protein A3743_28465 [Oleiphilus sp. HI0072]KZZ09813.1 hypothetical protein A3749_01650 [Oleiphilus sp. HI0078]KZZ24990.1 hypothetical protein A3752_24970 [Oleiphilus sp. HI0081]KZZ34918.1 hypothetical protein A3755_29270 [Oleiphilus sp. HI0085]KZZ65499.1 hypothetical protein A3763_18415 [Oleiphilus sp. HI0128]
MMAILAADTQKAIFQPTTLEKIFELSLNVTRQALSLTLQRGLKDRIMFLNQLIEERLFGLMAFIVWCLTRPDIPCR